MRSLFDFYAMQARLLWEWRGGPLALVKRLLITVAVATISFALTALVHPGLSVETFRAAALAVILMSLFNALIRPVILALIAPHSLILTGVAVLVLQIASFFVVAQWSPGVEVDGLFAALTASFLYAIINTTLTAIFGIDRGGTTSSFSCRPCAPKGLRRRAPIPGS